LDLLGQALHPFRFSLAVFLELHREAELLFQEFLSLFILSLLASARHVRSIPEDGLTFALETVFFFLVHFLGAENIAELQGPKDSIEFRVDLLPDLGPHGLFEHLDNGLQRRERQRRIVRFLLVFRISCGTRAS
jgi:hypothetical protein